MGQHTLIKFTSLRRWRLQIVRIINSDSDFRAIFACLVMSFTLVNSAVTFLYRIEIKSLVSNGFP